MKSELLLIPILVSFLTSLFFLPSWIKKAKSIGLIWDDMNKIKADKVAGSGGIIVLLGFFVGVVLFSAYRVFFIKNTDKCKKISDISPHSCFINKPSIDTDFHISAL